MTDRIHVFDMMSMMRTNQSNVGSDDLLGLESPTSQG